MALVGLGGIGKTQLAIELAYRLVRLAKSSIFWIHADSRENIEEGFRTIASTVMPRRWNMAKSDLLQSAYDWLSNERNGRWVIILDGANDDSVFQDEAYLPQTRNGTIVLTTRRRDLGERLTEKRQNMIEIGPMTVLEAVTLLKKKLGSLPRSVPLSGFSKSLGSRPRSGPASGFSKLLGPLPRSGPASSFVKSLGLIPLAICRAAAYIQSLPVHVPRDTAMDEKDEDDEDDNNDDGGYQGYHGGEYDDDDGGEKKVSS